MNIIFIGSFNPITKAHIMVAKEVLNIKDVDKIIFVPVSDLYNKNSLNTSIYHRIKMIEFALEDNMLVSDIEERIARRLNRQPKTFETLLALNEEYQNLVLLIGMDNYFDLPTWYKIDELLTKFKVMVYPRGKEKNDIEKSSLYAKYHDSFIFINPKVVSDISATIVRDKIRRHEDVDELLDERVKEYISLHKEVLNYE